MDIEVIEDKTSQGIMFNTNGKYEAAKKIFNEIIKENPRTIEAYIHLGNTYANLAEYDEAIETLKKALYLDDNYAEIYFSIGSIYVLKDNNVKAIEYFNKAEEKGFESSQMYQIMASIFFEAEDETQALRNINRAINIEPFNGELRLIKTRIYLAFNQYEQAIETLDEMEKLLPDSFEVYDLKSQIFLLLKKSDKALDIINKGCNRFPKDSNLANVKLKILVQLDLNEEAYKWISFMKKEDLFNKVIKEASISEATLLIKDNKIKEAANVLIEANRVCNEDGDLLYLLMDIYGKTNQNEKLLTIAEKLLDEQYGLFYNATAMFFHATALDELGKKENAIEEYKNITKKIRKATIHNPSFYEGYIYRMLSHTKLGEYKKALELADYIECLYPDKADSHAFKHYIYKEMGNIEMAEKEKSEAQKFKSNFIFK